MAMQEASPASSPPSAHVVGNAFVTQYYHILHQSPEYVYKFYQNVSVLSRPGSDGGMTSVTTMQEINDAIVSFGYANHKAEIETADSQESYKEGVIVLVTGCLTGKDNVRRKFTQTFFLAPQEKGYFVLNDVLRFVDSVSSEVNSMSVNSVEDSTPVASSPLGPEPIVGSDHPLGPTGTFEAEDINNNAEVYDPSDHEEGSILDEEVVDEPPTLACQVEANTVDVSDPSAPQEEKKSYASIVKVTKAGKASTSVYIPTNRTRVAPENADQLLHGPTKSPSDLEAPPPVTDSAPESTNNHEEGHSIYVRNLPLSASVEQLDEAFRNFGPIKHNGVQVRSSKGYCFGFVEFESLDSMLAAIQASPVTIGGREAFVEEKRTTSRGGNSGRGRYTSSRGGFRSDSFRGRGNFGGGRVYRSEVSGRTRGPSGRSVEGYRRVDHNASGKAVVNKSAASEEWT